MDYPLLKDRGFYAAFYKKDRKAVEEQEGYVLKKRRNRPDISCRAVLEIFRTEYMHMMTDPRNIVVLSMYLVFYEMILRKFIDMGVRMGKPINIVEPFLAVCSSEAVMLMFPLVFLVLISDFPRTEDNFRFYLVRVGKINWILGQMLYAFMTAFTYVVVTLAVTCGMAAPYSFVGNRWSDVATKFYLAFPEEKDSMINGLINGRLYNQTTPFEALFHTIFLYVLFLFLMSVVCFATYIFQERVAGTCICGVIIITGCFAFFGSMKKMWCFPVAHVIAWAHYDMVFRKMIYPFSGSYLYFLIWIAVGSGMIVAGIRHKNFDVENLS